MLDHLLFLHNAASFKKIPEISALSHCTCSPSSELQTPGVQGSCSRNQHRRDPYPCAAPPAKLSACHYARRSASSSSPGCSCHDHCLASAAPPLPCTAPPLLPATCSKTTCAAFTWPWLCAKLFNETENVSHCVIHHITNMGLIMVQSAIMVLDNEFLENPSPVHRVCSSMQSWEVKTNIRQQFYGFGSKHMFGRESSCRRRDRWRTFFALDTGGTPANGGQENLNGDSPGLGRTRLGTIVRTAGKQLLEKLNNARKNFPTKIFLLLLGFYTANALATILGQTGDWDVLVAGIVVAAIEGIGMLMYKRSTSMRTGRFQSLLEMVNFWKAGVCLGLFVDAFKLGS